MSHCKHNHSYTSGRWKNPWDSGWRNWLMNFMLLLLLMFLISLAYLFSWKPKLDVCETYYRELPRLSCFMSNYGLPARESKH